jgi:hypothetical protein
MRKTETLPPNTEEYNEELESLNAEFALTRSNKTSSLASGVANIISAVIVFVNMPPQPSKIVGILYLVLPALLISPENL